MHDEVPPSGRRLAESLAPFVSDARVLAAIAAVPREQFVGARQQAQAYDNAPLPIGCGQTISQPLVVARMCELLAPAAGERVLDIGTGSGYHAAVLAHLAAHVWSVERHARLSTRAAENLRAAGVQNVTLLVADGSRGLPDLAPFDAINVAAAAWRLVPPALEEQLAEGGRLVAPVDLGPGRGERLVLVSRRRRRLVRRVLEPVRFVPLIGRGGLAPQGSTGV